MIYDPLFVYETLRLVQDIEICNNYPGWLIINYYSAGVMLTWAGWDPPTRVWRQSELTVVQSQLQSYFEKYLASRLHFSESLCVELAGNVQIIIVISSVANLTSESIIMLTIYEFISGQISFFVNLSMNWPIWCI